MEEWRAKLNKERMRTTTRVSSSDETAAPVAPRCAERDPLPSVWGGEPDVWLERLRDAWSERSVRQIRSG